MNSGKNVIKCMIAPRFKIESEGNDIKITHSYSKDNKYCICESKIEQEINQIELNEFQSLNDDKIEYIQDIKNQDPTTSYVLLNEKSIISITNDVSDENDAISKITIHNTNEQNFSRGGSAIYKGVVYKLIISNSKAAFVYYHSKNEVTHGIKVFETIDDLLTQKVSKDIKSAHLGKINDILFTSDCKYLYSCGNDGIVKRWSLDSEELPVKSIFLTNGPISSVRLNPFNESLFVAACANGYLIFYSMEKDQEKKIIRFNNESHETGKKSSKDLPFAGPAIWADFSPNNPFLVFASGISYLKKYYIPDYFD